MERYLISGVQLGLIQEGIRSRKLIFAIKTLKEVFDNQFLGNSEDTLDEDVKKLSENFSATRKEALDKQFDRK